MIVATPPNTLDDYMGRNEIPDKTPAAFNPPDGVASFGVVRFFETHHTGGLFRRTREKAVHMRGDPI